jgi:hypothetical protein
MLLFFILGYLGLSGFLVLTVIGIFLKDWLRRPSEFRRVILMASTDRLSPFYGAFDHRFRPFCSRPEDTGNS